MTVVLDPHSRKAVEVLVAGGRYGSAEDVVREGARLVEAREAKFTALLEDIQSAIAEGGNASDEDLDADLEQLAAARAWV